MTGAVYDSRKRRWLLRTPRHQADNTSRPAPGNSIRTKSNRQRALRAAETWRDQIDQHRRGEHADQHDCAHGEGEQRADRAGDAIGVAIAAGDERRVDRNERRRQRAFAEQVLQEVGNAERGAERIGFDAEAEVVREDPLPDEAGHPREENADRDEDRGAAARHPRRAPARPACRWPSSSDTP